MFYRDAAGHYAFSSDFGDFGLATLFENGTSLGQSTFAAGQWVVSTGPADYRLQVMTNKGTAGGVQAPNWRMSTRTLTSFEFRSQRPADDDTVAVLPLVIPSYDLPLDEYNLTPAAPGFEITVSGAGQRDYDAGRIVSAKVWTSLDDGTTWVEAPVTSRGAGYVATVDNSSAAGRNVSLRVQLTDEHGAKVTQDVIRAYGVRRSRAPRRTCGRPATLTGVETSQGCGDSEDASAGAALDHGRGPARRLWVWREQPTR